MSRRTLMTIFYLAFFGGAIGVFGKFALHAFTPMMLILLRLIMSVLLFGVILLWRAKLGATLRLLWKERITFLALTASCIGGAMILGFIGLKQTNAVDYDLLMNMSAIFMIVFAALLFHERITPRDIALIALAFFGATLVATNDALTEAIQWASWRGNLLVGIGGIGWALYSILAPALARQNPDADPLAIVFNTFLLGIFFLFPYVLGSGEFSFALLDTQSALATLALGIFSTAILFYLWLEFVRTSGGVFGAFVTLGENIGGVLLPMIFLGEQPNLYVWVGGVLIVGAIIAKEYLPQKIH